MVWELAFVNKAFSSITKNVFKANPVKLAALVKLMAVANATKVSRITVDFVQNARKEPSGVPRLTLVSMSVVKTLPSVQPKENVLVFLVSVC